MMWFLFELIIIIEYGIYLPSNSLQLIKGSYTNASNTAIKLSLFSLSTLITLQHVRIKLPSIPVTCYYYMRTCDYHVTN